MPITLQPRETTGSQGLRELREALERFRRDAARRGNGRPGQNVDRDEGRPNVHDDPHGRRQGPNGWRQDGPIVDRGGVRRDEVVVVRDDNEPAAQRDQNQQEEEEVGVNVQVQDDYARALRDLERAENEQHRTRREANEAEAEAGRARQRARDQLHREVARRRQILEEFERNARQRLG